MSELAALYRAILLNPTDDTLRLVYADCLEEQAENAEEIKRVADIRQEVKSPADFYEIITENSGIQFIYERGFIAEVRLTCEQFLAQAQSLWAAHPITRCVLIDKEPGEDDNPGEHYFFWIKQQSLSISLPFLLPAAIFSVLDIEDSNRISTVMYSTEHALFYNSELTAQNALSRACCVYGRLLNGFQ